MDEDWSHMTEKILNLTLEIIYLLTGEDYEVVKKTTRKHITHREGQRLSKGFTKSRTPTISLPSSMIPEKINNKKILEVTQKIIELLTGEVPIRCQDVTVYFSMEEWEYLEGHKDLYKDVMMEDQPPLTSPEKNTNKKLQRVPSNLTSQPPLTSPEKNTDKKLQRVPSNLASQPPLTSPEKNTNKNLQRDPNNLASQPPLTSPEKNADKKPQRVPNILASLPPLTSPEKNVDKKPQRVPSILASQPTLKSPEKNTDKKLQRALSNLASQTAFTSRDGSSNRNTPERCPRPLYSRDSSKDDLSPSPIYSQDSIQEDRSSSPLCSQDSTQEDHNTPNHFSLENLTNIKVEEIDEEEEMLIRNYWRRKAEQGPIEIGAADGHMRKMSEEHLLLSADCHVKDEEFSQDSLEELPDTPNTFGGLHNRSPDLSHPGEASPANLDNVDMGQRGSKMFPCTVCGKWFTTYGGLLMHQRLHTGIKPFSCSFCGKSFTQKGILVNHEKIHRGIKPFPCSVCGKCFAKKSDVVRHLRVHTGEKPFPCARCGRCFSQKSSLLNHLRLYICEKPYPCFICGKRFSQRSDLGRHQEIHRRKKTSPWSE
ncbi:uncharacterized protein LOC143956245 isoform X5 [Lithobates pipiens]